MWESPPLTPLTYLARPLSPTWKQFFGTYTIEATFVDGAARTQRLNRATKAWDPSEICGNGIDDDGDGAVDEDCNAEPNCLGANASPDSLWPPNHEMVPISVHGVTDADGDTVTVTINSIRQDEHVNTIGDSTGDIAHCFSRECRSSKMTGRW